MKNFFTIPLFFILLTVMLVGCKSSSKYVVLDESKNEQTIKLKTGQFLVVKLKGNPTTGYIWEQKSECKLLRKTDESQFKSDNKELLGSPGTRIFSFEVISAGKDSLVFINHRPWEKDVKPLKRFSVTIQSE